jgi:MFS family permease
VIWGTTSFALSAKAVMRYGIKPPLLFGMALVTISLLLFARAPVDGNYVVDILPAMVLQGFGSAIAFNPILLAAMGDVGPAEAGLASGVVNTAFMMGGALGLAVIAALAASRTEDQLASGEDRIGAITSGYHLGFLVGAIFQVAAIAIAAVLLKPASAAAMAHGQPGAAEPAPAGAGGPD